MTGDKESTGKEWPQTAYDLPWEKGLCFSRAVTTRPPHMPLPIGVHVRGALLLTQALGTRNSHQDLELTSVHLHSWSGWSGFGVPTVAGCPRGWAHVPRAPGGAVSSVCLGSPALAAPGMLIVARTGFHSCGSMCKGHRCV